MNSPFSNTACMATGNAERDLMPELPEVETVRRELQAAILHKPIRQVKFWRKNLRYDLPPRMPRLLKGLRLNEINRRGKYLLMMSDKEWVVLAHLGMSGNFTVINRYEGMNEELKHRHVDIVFEDGSALVYCDPRRFGFMDLCRKAEVADNKHLRHMGAEPLSDEFNGDYLYRKTRNSKKPIKNLLLDQAAIAGVGNIYACEALWQSDISPRRLSGRLTRPACDKLAENIRLTLTEAIDKGGSSMRDFRHVSGEMGYFSHQWQCYGREGEACSRKGCGGTIRRLVQSGRSGFYCPKHQK